MVTCVQQITWHLKKELLERMLHDAAGNYSALEFKMCITDTGATKYYMTLIRVDFTAQNVCAGTVNPRSTEEEVCPVPPDCNEDPEKFMSVLHNYYDKNQITFTLNKDALVSALQ